MPHIHAEYGEFEAVYGFGGELIEGELPKKQRKLVEAWIAIHEDDLKANWNLGWRKYERYSV